MGHGEGVLWQAKQGEDSACV